jgi:hypothetical protein
MTVETMRELTRQIRNAKDQLYKLEMKQSPTKGDQILIDQLNEMIARLEAKLKGT